MTIHGVYVGNSLTELSNYDAWLGHKTDAVLGYVGRANWTDFTQSASWATKFWANTDKQVLWSVPLVTDNANLAAASHGDYNSYYKQVAQSLAAANTSGGDIIVRTGWEFNGQWFPWKAAGHEADYIGAYRQFVDTFRSVSDHFKFEWCPNNGDLGMNPENAYPGDSYVDIISMDVYYNTNWYPADPEAGWNKILTEKYGLQWHQDFAAAHGKPTAYSEWGVMNDSSGAYVQHMADWFARNHVVYDAYWNSNTDFAGKLSDNSKPDVSPVFRDALYGAPSAFDGTSGNDVLTGTAQGDRLDGKAGADTMSGGAGDDTYYVDNTGDRVIEASGGGTDTVRSYLPTYTLPDNVEYLVLMSNGNQTGVGNALANHIVGGTGDDTLDGGTGNDWLMGGEGNDTFIIRPGTGRDTIADFAAGTGRGDVVQIDSSSFRSFDQVKAAMEEFNGDTVLSLPGGDVVVFTGHKIADFAADDFTFTGTPPAPPPAWHPAAPATAPTPTTLSFTGTANADTMNGTSGNDYINGAGGNDVMIGGKGHDTYVVDQPGDRIVENPGEGIDRVESWSRSYTLPDNVEEIVSVASYGEALTGNALDNRITGGSGADTLDGAGGNDWLIGGPGNDTFVFAKGGGHDTIVDFAAGAGAGDTVRLDAAFGLTSFAAIKALMSDQGSEALLNLPTGDTLLFLNHHVADFADDDFGVPDTPPTTPPPVVPPPVTSGDPPASPGPIQYYRSGTGGNDTINGNDLNDCIDGSGGNDVMAGGKGNDIYVVDQPGDRVIEKTNEGIDTVRSWAKDYVLPDNVENLTMIAGYAQNGTGNALANRIEGTSAANRIDGGAGNDWLKGGGGADTFVIHSGNGSDTIADFRAGPGTGNVVQLDGYGLASFAQVKAGMVQQGADTLLSLPGGETLLFRNTTVGQFAADDFTFTGAVTTMAAANTGASPAGTTVVVRASAQSWSGDPLFHLLVDGHQVGSDVRVTTQHGQGWQEFTFVSPVDHPKDIGVQYFNDAYGGSAATDRNLFVDRITVNGQAMEAENAVYDRGWGGLLTGTETLTHNGVLHFDTSHLA